MTAHTIDMIQVKGLRVVAGAAPDPVTVRLAREPTIVSDRFFSVSIHETWMWATRPSAQPSVANTMSSIPRVVCRKQLPVALTWVTRR